MSDAALVRPGGTKTSEDTSRSHPTTLMLTVAGVAGIAAGLLAIAVVRIVEAPAPTGWNLLVALAALLIADTALVHVRFGGESESATFAEAMLAIVLILL